jgi:roadblock/LC7 domain-containing protein
LRTAAISVGRYGALLQPAIDCVTLNSYVTELAHLSTALGAFLPLSATSAALAAISTVPANVHTTLARLEAAIVALPEPTHQDAARDFLSVGQERLEAYRQASLKLKGAEQKAATSRFIYETYARVTTEALEAIYKKVEASFSELYRLVNHDDEEHFEAQLKPSIGKLAIDVDFYGRGFFPPGAYHSEGHQDGMGLCLYLALMNHLAGEAFTFAVLDDVLMSVDSGHRRQVSKMLRDKFPNTQFLLTTHDEIWLRHMKTVGLIESKGFVHFRTWNIDVGPTQWNARNVWEEIGDLLRQNDVRAAAGLLRSYLEHFSKEACQGLRAQVEFHGDAQFTLGDLLPNAIAKLKKLLKAGKAAAQSWSQADKLDTITKQEDRFRAIVAASSVEQWQVNAAVHYNEWANLHRNDFEPVVSAFKTLVEAFTCTKCNAMLFVTPEHGDAESVRCSCGDCNVNLRAK